ncbi:MAG TPA: aldehyde dehydrogenase family protein [Jatrophihabitans sp.]|nr:aldehyde dehydrogenase family protein [Jatrophihabitans sp.]
MTATTQSAGSAPTQRTFASLNPATGAEIATFPVHTAAEVQQAVERARPAARWWADLGEPGRRERLRRWRGLLVDRTEELAALIAAENGKPVGDAVLEVTIAVSHLSWAAGHAKRVLGRRPVAAGLLAVNHTATLEYLPFGVVGVIGPWNYPVHTPLGSISYALAAGNAVVFKPSEFTPAVGRWLVDTFAEVVSEQPVFQLVTGYGETGAALSAAGVDKLAFTGSAATGRRVMAACAETLTPCVVECGGKDPLIVAADADLDLAAEQAVWGAMFNAGQTCAGVERAYVEAPVYEEFTAKVIEQARRVSQHEQYGPITMPRQLEVIAGHIADALDRGGRALVGGRESVRPPYVEPVVLADVPAESSALTDETFGPTLVLTRVADVDEAVRLANSGRYGLGASVFSRGQGTAIARRIDAGMVSVNSVLTYASIPGLPWGGSKDSGFGRIHGPDGLREFARSRAITAQRFDIPLRLATFHRSRNAIEQLERLARARWRGRGRV